MVNLKFWQRGPAPSPSGGERGFYSTVLKAEATEALRVKPSRYVEDLGDKTVNWSTRCEAFDRYYDDCPEVKSQILTLAGRATGEGLFLSPRKDTETARMAVELCNDLNRDLGLDKLLYETVIPLCKYGTLLWEVDVVGGFDVQLIPVVGEYKPRSYRNFNVAEWEITEGGYSARPPHILGEEMFAEFSWNITSNSWPYGTSLLMGIGSTIEIIGHLINALDGYYENAAWPCGLFGIGKDVDKPSNDELQAIVGKIRNRSPSEQFATQYDITYQVIGPAQGETRILGDVLQFLKDRLVDGLLVAPISKMQQRTVASAEINDDNTFQAVVIPIQRLLKRVIERQVYWPYLKKHGFGAANVPSLSLTPPNKGRNMDAQFFISLVAANLISREAAARELGIEPCDVPTDADIEAKQLQNMPKPGVPTSQPAKSESNRPVKPKSELEELKKLLETSE